MKKVHLLLFLLSFVFSGCQLISPLKQTETKNFSANPYKSLNPQKPAKLPQEGQACGGRKKQPCQLPLFCVTNPNHPTGEGVCQNLIVDANLNCTEVLTKQNKPLKDPVCAIVNNQKYTFLNACEAARRGAKKTTKGFCKPQSSIKNNCQASAMSIGTCFNTNNAWEFDGEKCVEKFITGCDFEIPFESEQTCKTKCL